MNNVDNLAVILWDYLTQNDKVKKADCIIVCGGHDANVIYHAIEMYNANISQIIVVSGGIKRKIYSNGKEIENIEADELYHLAIKQGIPVSNIFIEKKAKSTFENIIFSLELLKEKNINPKNIVLIQKPYVSKRTLAIAEEIHGNHNFFISTYCENFAEYIKLGIPKVKIINMLVGEIYRLINYPLKGYFKEQYIPDDVMNAYTELIKLGYTDRI